MTEPAPVATVEHRRMSDPTPLTTQQLDRAIDSLETIMRGLVSSEREYCEEKFRGTERALILIEKQREELKIDTLRTTAEQKNDTKSALDAALAAAEKAVAAQTDSFDKAFTKSETATTKQMEQLGTTFSAQMTNMTANIDDLKATVSEIKNVKVGNSEAKTALYAFVGLLVSLMVLGGFIAAIWPT